MVRQHPQVDPPRCALAAIHFPELRTLTGDDTTAEPLPAALQQLATTAEALLDGSGHRPTGAKPAGGNNVHQPPVNTGTETLGGSVSQRGSNPEADSTAGKDAAVEMSNAAVAMSVCTTMLLVMTQSGCCCTLSR